MNKQYVEGVQKCEKAYFVIRADITTWVYCSQAGSETMSLLFKEQRQKEVMENCHMTPSF